MLIESQRLTCKPNQREAWVAVVNSVVLDVHHRLGLGKPLVLLDSTDPAGFARVRRFASEADRHQAYERLLADSVYKTKVLPALKALVDESRTRIERYLEPVEGGGGGSLLWGKP